MGQLQIYMEMRADLQVIAALELGEQAAIGSSNSESLDRALDHAPARSLATTRPVS